MLVRLIASAAAILLGAGSALAEPPRPQVDFQADWVMQGPGMPEMNATMRYSAELQMMRMEMAPQGMTMNSIRNMATGEMVMWSAQMPGMAMRMDTPSEFDDVTLSPTGETRTVGDEECMVATISKVQVCLTADDIPLEVSGEGFSGRLENLQRVSQDASLFEPPSDRQIMDMPTGMPGGAMMPEGALGLPF